MKTKPIAKTKPVANSGSYFQRIETNIKNGWIYPNALIRAALPAGKWGNTSHYYIHVDGKVTFVGCYPSWAGNTKKSKDYEAKKEVAKLKKEYPVYYLQEFVTMRS